ncbi:hypothetical protein FRACA_70053 [Frankia canadensis]|uniref:Uncharacterized protein n=1 Tax=Frankia canadensis TaxID=1836972 RepID=A0A2I2L0N5_9ACTN|nr:hypothetical protein FRACA_70053 [Frankia canadensis]SOU58727.1 hypothetical protein FRACA_70053 [Frankia canadensis]
MTVRRPTSARERPGIPLALFVMIPSADRRASPGRPDDGPDVGTGTTAARPPSQKRDTTTRRALTRRPTGARAHPSIAGTLWMTAEAFSAAGGGDQLW